MKTSLLTMLCVAGTATQAANWPQWRGPFFNGATTETNLPIQWSKTENVAWTTALPGYSGATPVVWGDSVFVSSPDEQKQLLLLCLDRKSGKIRWQKVVSVGNRDRGRNNMASPSPVTDGNAVYVIFATGDLAAFDFSGKELWRRELGKEYGHFANMWIYGSSPMLYRDHLYVQVIQSNPVPEGYAHAADDKSARESYLLCLDPKTGKNLWRQVRATDAIQESQESYTTPIPYEGRNGAEILVAGGNYVTAHRPDTGEELWRCPGLNVRGEPFWRIVPSPVAVDGMVFACGPKRDPVVAIRDGGRGLVTDSQIAWKFSEVPSDCPTPLVYQKKLFVLDGDKQMLACLDPQTGEKNWQGQLETREIFRASPTGADGRIYCISESGTAVVLAADQGLKTLATISMGESPVRSSIAVAHGQLFIRTAKNLYCIGRSGELTSR